MPGTTRGCCRGSAASMASSAPSGRGHGDKPPESAPDDSTGLDPPADPQRNGESPASPPAPPPPPDDDDRSVMGMMEGPDDHRRARARRRKKRPIRVVLRQCPACEVLRKISHDERSPVRRCSACEERKKMREARRRLDPPANRPSDGEFSPLPSAPAPSSGDGQPVLGLAMELPYSRAQALDTKRPCSACELRKKRMLDRREAQRRLYPPANHRWNGEFSTLPPPSSGDGNPVLGLGMELPDPRLRALCVTKRPLSPQTGGCEKLGMEVPGIGSAAGGSRLHEKMLDEREGPFQKA